MHKLRAKSYVVQLSTPLRTRARGGIPRLGHSPFRKLEEDNNRCEIEPRPIRRQPFLMAEWGSSSAGLAALTAVLVVSDRPGTADRRRERGSATGGWWLVRAGIVGWWAG